MATPQSNLNLQPPATPAPQSKPADDTIDLETFEQNLRDHFKIPKNLTRSLSGQESAASGDTKAIGPTTTGGERARGRYQVLPSTAQGYGMDAADPFQNAYAAHRYLREQYDAVKDKFDNDQDRW